MTPPTTQARQINAHKPTKANSKITYKFQKSIRGLYPFGTVKTAPSRQTDLSPNTVVGLYPFGTKKLMKRKKKTVEKKPEV